LIRNDYPWGGGAAGTQVLANITVLKTAVDMDMPATIPGTPPPYLQPITSYTPNARAAIFGAIKASQWAAKCTGPKPAPHPAGILPSLDVINCKEYMPPPTPDAPANSAYDQFIVKLNTAEQWVLSNAGGSAHPFHLHVNPFQVEGMLIDPAGPNDPTNWMFVDTVPLIPPGSANPPLWAQGGQIKIRTRYMTYYGRYVTHCHILVHEDLGMMANIYVQDDGTGIGPCKKI
jgi:FtsP/CotA-like multicopper oxidase with cupredoxin domain